MINLLFSTLLFGIILCAALAISIRRKEGGQLFPLSQSQELKGLAILCIVFAHIDYFSHTGSPFLFSLPIMAGVGVDLFLFLSGFGLTLSALKNGLSIMGFYRVHLLKLFIPLWLSLIAFLCLDFFVLHITYRWQFILKAFIGFFPSADIYKDLNSPLWYITLILFYYLVFPLFFSKKRVWISAILILLATYAILLQNTDPLSWVTSFYVLHTIAFPLGMVIGEAIHKISISRLIEKLRFRERYPGTGIYYFSVILLLIFIGGLAYFFAGQRSPAIIQAMSILATLAIVGLFLLKKIEFRLLQIFGIYSYEIYLLHWPIIYRYDIFYKYLPAWLATICYLIFFVVLAWIVQKISKYMLEKAFPLIWT